jgi:hypothetical protein
VLRGKNGASLARSRLPHFLFLAFPVSDAITMSMSMTAIHRLELMPVDSLPISQGTRRVDDVPLRWPYPHGFVPS